MQDSFSEFLNDPVKTCLSYIETHFRERYDGPVTAGGYGYSLTDIPLADGQLYLPLPWRNGADGISVLTPAGMIPRMRSELRNHEVGVLTVPYASLEIVALIACCQILHRKQLSKK